MRQLPAQMAQADTSPGDLPTQGRTPKQVTTPDHASRGNHYDQAGPYGITPRWLIRSDLSLGAKALYGTLHERADKRTMTAWVSRATLADDLGTATQRPALDTIRRWANELRDYGAVVIGRTFNESGQTGNRYFVVLADPHAGARGHLRPVSDPPSPPWEDPPTHTSPPPQSDPLQGGDPPTHTSGGGDTHVGGPRQPRRPFKNQNQELDQEPSTGGSLSREEDSRVGPPPAAPDGAGEREPDGDAGSRSEQPRTDDARKLAAHVRDRWAAAYSIGGKPKVTDAHVSAARRLLSEGPPGLEDPTPLPLGDAIATADLIFDHLAAAQPNTFCWGRQITDAAALLKHWHRVVAQAKAAAGGHARSNAVESYPEGARRLSERAAAREQVEAAERQEAQAEIAALLARVAAGENVDQALTAAVWLPAEMKGNQVEARSRIVRWVTDAARGGMPIDRLATFPFLAGNAKAQLRLSFESTFQPPTWVEDKIREWTASTSAELAAAAPLALPVPAAS